MLRDSDMFCPSCGANADSYTVAYSSDAQHMYYQPRRERLNIVVILSAIWAVIAILFGLFLIFVVGSLLLSMDQLADPWYTLWDTYGFTLDYLHTVVITVGVMFVVSGALAAVTAYLSHKKKFYIGALFTCIISSCLVMIFLVGVIGFIVVYRIYKGKNEFEDKPRKS
jgi:ABC-type Fe3+ transport system permease subunit